MERRPGEHGSPDNPGLGEVGPSTRGSIVPFADRSLSAGSNSNRAWFPRSARASRFSASWLRDHFTMRGPKTNPSPWMAESDTRLKKFVSAHGGPFHPRSHYHPSRIDQRHF